MPRTNAVAPVGCPPIRALSFDNLGLIKVVESSTESGHPQVVARWGDPNPQKSVVAASLSADEDSQVLAVARKNSYVEILDPFNGAMYAELNVATTPLPYGCVDTSENSKSRAGVVLIGVHPLRAEASGLRPVLTCTDTGNATLQHFFLKDAAELNCSEGASTSASWSVCKSGSVLCMKVDRHENYAAFGGDGADVTVWDIKTQRKFWEAKAPRRDSNGLMSPAFVTASTFLGDDHRKLIIGTGQHQVRLYDTCAQRRPVIAFDFRESPIKAIEADTDGYTIFVGTGNGDLASFDMRSGKLLGSFKGKVSGSIRSIAVHPTLPIFATCGLDRFLRVFQKESRQLLTRVFLKQPLVKVVFDGMYPNKPAAVVDAGGVSEGQEVPLEKLKKSHQTERKLDTLLDTENDAQHQGSIKIHKKRKSGKDLAEGKLFRPHKKKKGGSSTSSTHKFAAQMHEEDQRASAREDAKPKELARGGQEEAAVKLKRGKRQKMGMAA